MSDDAKTPYQLAVGVAIGEMMARGFIPWELGEWLLSPDQADKITDALMKRFVITEDEDVGITYHVLNEKALGYISALMPKTFWVLASRPDGPDPMNGAVAYQRGIDTLREATLDDFAAYRVSPRGHLAEAERE